MSFNCTSERCYSPIACNVFGYCRYRNQDRKPINKAENARRKAESDAAYEESKPNESC